MLDGTTEYYGPWNTEHLNESAIYANDYSVRYYIDWKTGESFAHYPDLSWISSQAFEQIKGVDFYLNVITLE